MGLTAVSKKAGVGAAGAASVGKAVYELQGLTVTLVDGAAAGTKMNIAAMTPDDLIKSVIAFPDAGGAPVDDTANVTIQPKGATGTVTIAAVADGESVTIGGTEFVFKNAPTAITHAKRTAGNNNANAQALVDAINAYKHSYGRGNDRGSLPYTAAANGAVVTFTAVATGTAGNSITLASSDDAVTLAVSGATLSGGTATGGIKSTTNHSTNTLQVTWIDVDR